MQSLEERVRMLRKLYKEGHMHERKLREAESHAQQLRGLLRIGEGNRWKC